jgi:plasmid rolling circle replication initiator protein Rep
MLLDKDHFLKLDKKKSIAFRNAGYLKTLAYEFKGINENFTYSLLMRSERIENCLNYWEWDLYKENKVLNLNKVSRCKDYFCPNCRSVNSSKAIIKFSPLFQQMLSQRYYPYFMTLTVPNVLRKDLANEIDKMNKAFIKFWRWLYKPFKENGKYSGGYIGRLFDAMGAVKVIEVTLQKTDWDYFNVHFHVIIFLDNDFEGDFIKYIDGGYRIKSQDYIGYSDADVFIQRLWTMAYKNKKISEFNRTSDCEDNFICDIRELSMPFGIYELFKYVFKDTDIKDYEVFRDLFFGLRGKRLKQGYGMLYNFKNDDSFDDSSDIKDFLEDKDEDPVTVATKCIKEMNEKYREYKKISIYKEKKFINKN